MNSPRQLLWLSSKDIEALLTYEAVNQRTEETLHAHGLDLTILPEESRLKWEEDAYIIAKPGAVKPINGLGIKWLSNFRRNSSIGLPPNFALIILNDPKTGAPLAIMDGDVISKMRTASVSAVAAKYLAKKKPTSMGIIGTGIQGQSHLWAVTSLLEVSMVKAYDTDEPKLRSFSADAKRRLPEVSTNITKDPGQAAKDVDILIVASTSNVPVIYDSMVDKGCLVVGLTGFRDLDSKMKNTASKYVVDDRRNAPALIRTLMGRVEVAPEEIYGEIGEIIAGKLSGREDDSERILFTPTGLGTVDVAVAQLVYEKASAKGAGQLLEA
ncbi:MAG: ornithine cyclodeaminase family protein [Thaumarchaeota archaeon]|nr:ornithine cyclodeaminase family protein [Nitrososphaerota archaeon]